MCTAVFGKEENEVVFDRLYGRYKRAALRLVRPALLSTAFVICGGRAFRLPPHPGTNRHPTWLIPYTQERNRRPFFHCRHGRERERERGEWKKKKKENCWFAALQPTTEGSCMTGVAFIDELKGFEDGINRTECEARDTCSKAREDDERLCALLCARQPLLRNNFERDDELQGGKGAEQVFAPSSFSRYWRIERCDDGEAPRDDWSYLGLAVAGIRRRRWISNCSAPFHLMQMLQSTCPVPSGPAVPFLLGPFSPSSSIATGTLAVSDNFS